MVGEKGIGRMDQRIKKKEKESRKKQSLVQFGKRGAETDFRETALSDPEEIF